MSKVKTGRVKFYNVPKGFGFISDNETNDEYFVHATGILDNVKLNEEDEVSYELVEGKKGLNAVEVTLLD